MVIRGAALVVAILAFASVACGSDDSESSGAGASTASSSGGGVGGVATGGAATGGSGGTAAGGSGGSGGTATGGSGGSGGMATGGSGGSGGCDPGAEQPCYSGPAATEGVGLCAAGSQLCGGAGSWGACEGEVVPGQEHCSTLADEDCDGQTPACTGDTSWSARFGDATNTNHSLGGSATDAAGNTVIVGQFYNLMDFGAAGILDAESGLDGFVAKLDPLGVPIWARHIATTNAIFLPSVALDAQSNIAVVGHFQDDVDAGGGVLVGDSSNWDVFVASFDTDGNHRFSKIFGAWSTIDIGWGVASGPAGDIAITGQFRNSINFGGNQLNATSGSPDLFVAKLDTDGNHIWSRRFGDAGAQNGAGVAITSNGDVVVSGYNTATIDFGGQPLTSAGVTDIVVARLASADGQHLWSHQYGDSGWQDGPNLVNVDGDDNVILSTFSSSANEATIDFGTGSVTGYFFLVKLDSGGTTQWVRNFDGLRGINDTAIDAAGAILVAGATQGSTDWGGGPESAPGGNYDIAIAKYDPAGNFVWSRVVADYNQQDGSQYASGVDCDGQGHIYAAGTFSGNIHFGDQELVSGMGFGGSDVWVAKLEP